MKEMTVQPNEITRNSEPTDQPGTMARDLTRLTYVAKDGTPRNVPIAFRWNGSEIVMCTAKNAPKLEEWMDGIENLQLVLADDEQSFTGSTSTEHHHLNAM